MSSFLSFFPGVHTKVKQKESASRTDGRTVLGNITNRETNLLPTNAKAIPKATRPAKQAKHTAKGKEMAHHVVDENAPPGAICTSRRPARSSLTSRRRSTTRSRSSLPSSTTSDMITVALANQEGDETREADEEEEEQESGSRSMLSTSGLSSTSTSAIEESMEIEVLDNAHVEDMDQEGKEGDEESKLGTDGATSTQPTPTRETENTDTDASPSTSSSTAVMPIIPTPPRERPVLPPGAQDIDILDENDPQWVTDYVNDIYDNLRENERRLRPANLDFLETVQKNLTPSMRAILVDWLVEVAEEYELSSETLYLAVNYLDRFIGKQAIDRRKFQLVGVTCMLIAAKYEGVYAPAVDEFVYISANTYKREEIILMEACILNGLGFSLAAATAKVFLRRYLKAAGADLTLAFLASYLAELTLQEYSFVKYLPSLVASASVFLALRTLGREPWNATLEHYTSYSLQDREFQQCIHELYQLQVGAVKHQLQAIYEKYAHSRFHRVSTIPAPVIRSSDSK